MTWMDWVKLVSMGGFGIYVWSAYGLVLSVLIGLMVETWLKQRQLLTRIKQSQSIERQPAAHKDINHDASTA